jgi:hypothetical protein
MVEAASASFSAETAFHATSACGSGSTAVREGAGGRATQRLRENERQEEPCDGVRPWNPASMAVGGGSESGGTPWAQDYVGCSLAGVGDERVRKGGIEGSKEDVICAEREERDDWHRWLLGARTSCSWCHTSAELFRYSADSTQGPNSGKERAWEKPEALILSSEKLPRKSRPNGDINRSLSKCFAILCVCLDFSPFD